MEEGSGVTEEILEVVEENTVEVRGEVATAEVITEETMEEALVREEEEEVSVRGEAEVDIREEDPTWDPLPT